MTTSAQTTDDLNISQIIYFTANAAVDPPFIPVNAPNVNGAGIMYGGEPAGNQTIDQAGVGYTAGVAETELLNDQNTDDADGAFYYGQGLTVTLTVNATGGVTQAAVANSGTGYITGQRVQVKGNPSGSQPCILIIVGAAADADKIVEAGKEAELEQCQRLYPFNTDDNRSYSTVANGSNVAGVGSLTITQTSGTLEADEDIIFQANITDSQAGGGTGAITYTWVANGAGLTNNAGTAVAGEADQRQFTPTAEGTLVLQCTVTYATSGSGAVAQNSFTIAA